MFPPMIIHVGDREILLDDSTLLHQKALSANVDCSLKVWGGLFHCFSMWCGVFPEATASCLEIAEWLRKILHLPSRYVGLVSDSSVSSLAAHRS